MNRAWLLKVEESFQDLGSTPSRWRLGFDGKALIESIFGSVVGLIALFSSYDHVNLSHRQLPLPQQWGIWLIALSLPLVFADAQLAARSRRREADRLREAESRRSEEARDTARERARVAQLDALRARLDRGRLAFQLDPSPNNRRKLQRLLSLLNTPELARLYRQPLS